MDELMTTDVCTLPSVDRPLRLAEFDELFRESVCRVDRGQLTARLTLHGKDGLRARVADLTARESECCSFFEFDLDGDDRELVLSITVPAARADILNALADRAAEVTA
jgi:hypothetical protein